MKLVKSIVVIILIAVAVYGVVKFTGNLSSQKVEVQNTSKEVAYDFNLKKIGKDEYIRLSDFSGRPVFIDFWASWCPPCRQSTPYVKKLHQEFKGRIEIIGISLDRDLSAARSYIEKSSTDYIQLQGANSEVSKQYGVRGIPAFFIVDKEGKIVKKYVGFHPSHYEEWVSVLNSIIE
jgi:thiol-disulfide isomerase/thioredoxin